MNRIGWFLLGAVSLLLALGVVIGIGLARPRGFSAREKPTPIEGWLARQARTAALPAGASLSVNPVPNTEAVLAEASAHWADHCASCHGNDGGGDTVLGQHMYPPAPDMRRPATQNLSDGELFFIIQNGIRLTGMPAWGGSDRDAEDSWKLVRFIRHLPALTFEERKAMEKLNPKGPEDRKEEEEEEKFLRGEDIDEPQAHHHH